MSKEIPLKNATVAQLREYAGNVMGLHLEENLRQPQIVSKIRQANPDLQSITVFDESGDDAPVKATPPTPAGPTPPRPGRTRLMIQTSEITGGDRPIQVSVNGSMMLIPRGELVDVPDPFAEVLKNAVETRYEERRDADGNIIMVPRHVARFPVSYFGATPPTIEGVAA